MHEIQTRTAGMIVSANVKSRRAAADGRDVNMPR